MLDIRLRVVMVSYKQIQESTNTRKFWKWCRPCWSCSSREGYCTCFLKHCKYSWRAYLSTKSLVCLLKLISFVSNWSFMLYRGFCKSWTLVLRWFLRSAKRLSTHFERRKKLVIFLRRQRCLSGLFLNLI